MLHALELENFKAFGERTHIPFAPITLIFGENSAGKSTILQALNLLKQTRESRESGGVLLPQTKNGIVDLGSFQEIIFDHDLKQTLAIRIEATVDRRYTFRVPQIKNKIAIELRFKQPSVDEMILLDQIGIYEGGSSKCLARFRPLDTTEVPKEFLLRMGFSRNLHGIQSSRLPIVKCVWLTKNPKYWRPEFEWCEENLDKVLSRLEEKKLSAEKAREHLKQYLNPETSEEGSVAQKRFNEDVRRMDNEYHRDLKSLSASLKFFSSGFDLKTYIAKRHEEEMSMALELEGPFPTKIIAGERETSITGTHSLLLWESHDTEAFNVAELAMVAGSVLEQTLEAFFPMGPFRRPSERVYRFVGTSPQHAGYQGDFLPDLLFLDSELVKETNEWLKELKIDYELAVNTIGSNLRDLFEVRLIDTRRRSEVDVALPDVGYGISQLLPFIVQSLISKRRIISIEQPEVHVHPKLQADLGDLLAAAIKEPRQNRFIIETHSEHLILRLQRLVRKQQIKPEDVSVIYVSRGSEGAKAERLHLDEEGDFIDEWPNGFFLERLRELR